MRFCPIVSVLALGLWCGPTTAQEDKVYRMLTTDQLEATLKGAGIDFKKSADQKPNSFLYDFKNKAYNVRLYYLDGKQLMMDTLLGAQALEKVNEWNLSSHFSRAGLGKDDKGAAYTVLACQLNLKGGVTAGGVQEFFSNFPEELDKFQVFARGEPRKDVAVKEPAFKEVTPEKMEKLLEEMKIKFTKAPVAKGTFAYHYEAKGAKVVLTNWGKDMMLEAKFPKMTIAKVNQYNLERKFILAVSYTTKNGDYTTLEVNLNFLGGVTDSIIRNFVAVFDEDISEFTKYSQTAK